MREHQIVGDLQIESVPRAPSASPVRATEAFGLAVARFIRWLRRISTDMVEAQRDKAQREITSHLRLSDDALLGIGLDAKQIEHMRAKGSSAPLSK